jgi:hypothetical protein
MFFRLFLEIWNISAKLSCDKKIISFHIKIAPLVAIKILALLSSKQPSTSSGERLGEGARLSSLFKKKSGMEIPSRLFIEDI